MVFAESTSVMSYEFWNKLFIYSFIHELIHLEWFHRHNENRQNELVFYE